MSEAEMRSADCPHYGRQYVVQQVGQKPKTNLCQSKSDAPLVRLMRAACRAND